MLEFDHLTGAKRSGGVVVGGRVGHFEADRLGLDQHATRVSFRAFCNRWTRRSRWSPLLTWAGWLLNCCRSNGKATPSSNWKDHFASRCGVGRVFVRYSDACASLICGADFGAVQVAIVSINSRSSWVLNSESTWI